MENIFSEKFLEFKERKNNLIEKTKFETVKNVQACTVGKVI